MAFNVSLFLLGLNVNGAIASGDFTAVGGMDAVNGVYTLNGSPCTLADLLDEASSKYLFNPALDMDAGGIKVRVTDIGGGNFSYTGRALPLANPLLATMLADGFTLVVEGTWGSESSDALFVEAMNADESFYADAYGQTSFVELTSFAGNSTNSPYNEPAANQVNKFAITMTDARSAISVNGGAVHTMEEPALDATTTTIFFGVSGHEVMRLRKFTIYPPTADGDLPGLSAL